jgi:hypothetical protein
MANVTSPDIVHKVRHMAEFGNCISEDFPALALTGVAATEKAYVGVIPAGTRVQKLRVEPITFNKAVKIVVLVNTADVENSPTVTVYYAGQALGAP